MGGKMNTETMCKCGQPEISGGSMGESKPDGIKLEQRFNGLGAEAQRHADEAEANLQFKEKTANLRQEIAELKKECDCHEELLRKCNSQAEEIERLKNRIKQYEEMWGDITRQDFLKLPLETRRKVLAKQAKMLSGLMADSQAKDDLRMMD
jgi:predicted RNase H-like nuclease (RuvC/YqgF family)